MIQSPITRGHLVQLADALGVGSRDLHLVRRDGRLGVVAVPEVADVANEAFAERSIPRASASSTRDGRPVVVRRRPSPRRSPATSGPGNARDRLPRGAIVGVGIPIGALLVADAQNATEALNIVITGVAAAYVLLTLVVARISARVRAQSTERRMRLPWVAAATR